MRYDTNIYENAIGHLPRGRCGLKSLPGPQERLTGPSPSARKVWIEILKSEIDGNSEAVTFREEGVD